MYSSRPKICFFINMVATEIRGSQLTQQPAVVPQSGTMAVKKTRYAPSLILHPSSLDAAPFFTSAASITISPRSILLTVAVLRIRIFTDRHFNLGNFKTTWTLIGKYRSRLDLCKSQSTRQEENWIFSVCRCTRPGGRKVIDTCDACY